MRKHRRFHSDRPPSRSNRTCTRCFEAFTTRYKGKVPLCWNCKHQEQLEEKAKLQIGTLLQQWRERKIAHLVKAAQAGDLLRVTQLLQRPDYARLLESATPELIREIRDSAVTSFREYVPASLLSTLCARVDPHSPIPTWLTLIIRPIVAAFPGAILHAPSPFWVHPIDFLRRGDGLFEKCRNLLFGDVRWGSDIHSLLRIDVQECYQLLSMILWKRNVNDVHIFNAICSFLPPVIQNNSSNFASKTVLEIAHEFGAKITQSCWEKVTLEMIACLMSQEMGTFVHTSQLATLPFYCCDILELPGVVGVPELRPSGNTVLSIAFKKEHVFGIREMIQKATTSFQNKWALRALGVSGPCHIAMTQDEFATVKGIVEAADPESDVSCRHWLEIQDDTAVDEARRGPEYDETEDLFD